MNKKVKYATIHVKDEVIIMKNTKIYLWSMFLSAVCLACLTPFIFNGIVLFSIPTAIALVVLAMFLNNYYAQTKDEIKGSKDMFWLAISFVAVLGLFTFFLDICNLPMNAAARFFMLFYLALSLLYSVWVLLRWIMFMQDKDLKCFCKMFDFKNKKKQPKANKLSSKLANKEEKEEPVILENQIDLEDLNKEEE